MEFVKYNYILGLDIGIASVGWGLLAVDDNNQPYKIIDVGSRIFTPGEESDGESKAKKRRENRETKRVVRRREHRLDRVRNLLHEKGFLTGDIADSLTSIKNEKLTALYNDMINSYYSKNITNPYKLKVEALDRKLSKEEMSIILVHYAKKRGYKSNRETENDIDNDKVLGQIKENRGIMEEKKYRTVSEMYVKDEKFKNKIKNSPGSYHVSVTNEMYLSEINKVLDSQIAFCNIDDNFKNEYLKIYNSRRNYSEGPGYYYKKDIKGNLQKIRSPYGGNLIKKMTGTCVFDNAPRAPKYAFSSELFVALSNLLNLRYKIADGEYKKLNKDEILNIIEEAKEKNEVNYKSLVKILGQENIKFKNLNLSKSEYGNLIKKIKETLNISVDTNIDVSALLKEKENNVLYNELYNDKLFSKKLVELKGYHALRKAIVNKFSVDIWNEVKNNLEFLDELALYCTDYKTYEGIQLRIKESNIIDSKFSDIEFIKELPNFKDHLMLSTDIIKKLIPIMIDGISYDEAMEKLGYNHANPLNNIEKRDLLVPICVSQNITNQRVVRSLTQARKVINAVIKKYGMPKMINVETARDLAKTLKERNLIKKNQEENQNQNEEIKKFLVDNGIFSNVNQISGNDLLKYKLWQEQKEFCSYSMEKIKLEDLFINNIVQVDHILPYSRTYNDSYLNKTLVYTKYNQDKGNKTPFEWFGQTDKWEEYESFINSLHISQNKKDNYLLKKLDPDTEREMKSQSLNDTKYISRELSKLLKTYLDVPTVNMFQGAITAKLRARWGGNRLTHSYISKNYIMPNDMKPGVNKDRDNHLHHAMDALIIASITKSLQQKVTLYEKFSRYIDGVIKNSLLNIKVVDSDDKSCKFYDELTGEITNEVDFREYLKEQIRQNNIYFSKNNVSKLNFPLPYPEFLNEAKERVYEQDLEILKWNLKKYGTYTKKELENVHTLTPSIAKVKLSGRMHKDTYYGIVKENDEIVYKTLRTPLEKVKREDLEKIPDYEAGAKDIYNTLVEWFGDDKKGEAALKHHGGIYPVNKNDKENKAIKKIKIYSKYTNTGHIVNNCYVEKGEVYRIDIFRSKNKADEKLYFAAYDLFCIGKIKEYKEKGNMSVDFNIRLDYGRDKNNIVLSYDEVLNNYDLYMSLYKNDLVKIKTKKGRESIAYVNGFSEGKIEVKSKIGDDYDLICGNNVFNDFSSRYPITISTISEIQKLHISILGEISGI